MNRGFVSSPGGRRLDYDPDIDGVASVGCGRCGKSVPAGVAHIVTHPCGPSMHVMFCPEHCPCANRLQS